jgi:hypothetical protein
MSRQLIVLAARRDYLPVAKTMARLLSHTIPNGKLGVPLSEMQVWGVMGHVKSV